jgi:hypothetical protein
MKILMIGNSFCYYFVEELYGMAKAVGIELEICNVYYSGCSLEKYWKWLVEGASNYERIYLTNSEGRNLTEGKNLPYALELRDWDVISLQAGSPQYIYEKEDTVRIGEPYIGNLYQYLREKFPNAKYYWHHTWSSQVGYRHGTDPNNVVLDQKEQARRAENAAYFSEYACKKYEVSEIPTGPAWQLAREDLRIGDTLTNRVNSKGEDKTDCHHDGNIGGGRYLNACVWFEVLTGQSPVGNTYVPPYDLSKEKIEILQKIAHEAVKRKLH